jgi:hypothetical protein
MNLPPSDPCEPFSSEPAGLDWLAEPTVIFAHAPSREMRRLASAILKARPGVLYLA